MIHFRGTKEAILKCYMACGLSFSIGNTIILDRELDQDALQFDLEYCTGGARMLFLIFETR